MRTIACNAEQLRYGGHVGRCQKRRWAELSDQIATIVKRYNMYKTPYDYLYDWAVGKQLKQNNCS
jgi:hypothetical protein